MTTTTATMLLVPAVCRRAPRTFHPRLRRVACTHRHDRILAFPIATLPAERLPITLELTCGETPCVRDINKAIQTTIPIIMIRVTAPRARRLPRRLNRNKTCSVLCSVASFLERTRTLYRLESHRYKRHNSMRMPPITCAFAVRDKRTATMSLKI